MDFLKKAKAKSKELQGHMNDLQKSAASLGLGDKKSKSSSDSTPASTTAPAPPPADTSGDWKEVSSVSTPTTAQVQTPVTPLTPASTVPVNEKPKVKLSLIQRKNLRDEWEQKQSKLEERLTKALGVQWTCQADAAVLLNPKGDGVVAKIDSPGAMIHEYIDSAVEKIEKFVKTYEEPGKQELNSLASTHTLALDLDDKEKKDIDSYDKYYNWHYNRPQIRDGVLYILINRESLWSNARVAGENLGRALLQARKSDPHLASQIDFECVNSIKKFWEPADDELLARAQKLLNNDKVQFDPNWQETWAKLNELYWQKEDQKTLDNHWQENFGAGMLAYFKGLVNRLQENGFEKDDLLQEGFNEAVDKNTIVFRFQDTLSDGAKSTSGRNEVAIENGVLYLLTKPEYWRSNEDQMGQNLMSLL